ncbi:MAG: hypothetical protein ACK5XS_06615 [Armatimonadota bacterium]|jgi:uncharacterized protein (DUF58 family)|nr:hypothetical protein [Fimbriimonadaceae bacterium]
MRPFLWALVALAVVGCQPSAAPEPTAEAKPAAPLAGPGSKFIEAILKEDFTAAFAQADSQNPELRNPQSLVAAYEAWLARNRRGGNAQWRPVTASAEASMGTLSAEAVVSLLRERGQLPAGDPVTVYWMLGADQAKTSVAIAILTDGTAPDAKVKAAAFVAASQEEGTAATTTAP